MADSNDNLKYWGLICQPPAWALKPIQAGRLKGKTDISPMWRMMAMTETFGPCGQGWKYTIDKLWLERGASVKGRECATPDVEVAAFALVSLYYKVGEHWSEAIPGIGGSMFTEMEKSGPFNSDEAYKMAITDALSVAFKALGMAANIYSGDRFDGSKYMREQRMQQSGTTGQATTMTDDQAKYFPRVKAALDSLFGADVAAKKKEIAALTEFKGKDDKMVPGVEDYRKLDGKRLQILCDKLEKTVEQAKKNTGGEAPPKTETCPKCDSILSENGTCPTCPPF